MSGLDNLKNLILYEFLNVPNWSLEDSSVLSQKIAKNFFIFPYSSYD